MKILVVDDSMAMRKILSNHLKNIGYTELVEASNGKEALQAVVDNEGISLILCDWNMPEMNGLEFLKKFREEDKKTPFIMVTTESEKDKVVDAIQAGVSSYILKPFSQDVLKEKIHQATQV